MWDRTDARYHPFTTSYWQYNDWTIAISWCDHIKMLFFSVHIWKIRITFAMQRINYCMTITYIFQIVIFLSATKIITVTNFNISETFRYWVFKVLKCSLQGIKKVFIWPMIYDAIYSRWLLATMPVKIWFYSRHSLPCQHERMKSYVVSKTSDDIFELTSHYVIKQGCAIPQRMSQTQEILHFF